MLTALRKCLSALAKGRKDKALRGLPVLSGTALLAAPHRQALLAQTRQMVCLSPAKWQELYQETYTRFAELVQELPASEVHHHAGRGGMLDHSLEAARNALKIRQGYVLPKGAPPELIQPMGELYSYAVFTGTLLHDIGKIISDQVVTVFDEQNRPKRWRAWEGRMQGRYYQIQFQPERQYRVHERLPLLVATKLLPSSGLAWLASDVTVWSQWVMALTGDYESAGSIGEIIGRADRTSVATNLGAKAVPVAASPTAKPLEQRLLTALRFVLTEGKLALNRKGAAGWITDEALWLVSKPVLDALRAHLIAEGHTGIPSENARLMDTLQEHGLLIPNADKAIWNCVVDDGQGWNQPLTMLRFDPSQFWPQDRLPALFTGTVTPAGTTGTPTTEPPAPPAAASAQARVTPARPMPSVPAPVAETASVPSAPSAATGTDPYPEPPMPASLLDELPMPPGFDSLPVPAAGPTYNLPAKTVAAPPPASIGPGPVITDAPLTERGLGEQFVAWLRDGIASRRITINDASAKVHTVAGGAALISPGVFQRFVGDEAALCAEYQSALNSDKEAWVLVQKAFQKLGLHQRTPDTSENIHRFVVKGPRKDSEVKGYFLPDAKVLFGTPPPDNPHVKLKALSP